MPVTIKSENLRSIPFQEIKAATKNFTSILGRGGYGPVYRGELSLSAGIITTVAVKRLPQNDESGQGLKEFLTEIHLLSHYKHPNLVSLLGYCEEGREKILIYEYAENGSFDNYLKNVCTLTWKQRVNICIDAARGLDYLHNHVGTNHRIIHRDIKSANILLDANLKAKIADLGLSKIGRANENETFLITNVGGTLGYCDPLYLKTGILTKKSDVYSFGVVLFEVLCGRLCFMNVTNEKRHLVPLARRLYLKGKLNVIMDLDLKDSESLKEFSEIAYQCVHDDQERRPSMDVVLQKLEKALESLEFEEACILQKLEEALGLQELVETLQKQEVVEALVLQEFDAALELQRSEEILDSLHKLGEILDVQTDYSLEETIYIITGSRPPYTTKEDTHTHLSPGILIDHCNVWFFIDENKKNQEMIPAMTLMHPHPNKYEAISLPESRFPMVARILNASDVNMQVRIRTHFLSSEVTYAAYLVYKHKEFYGDTGVISLKYKLGDQNRSYISYHGECKTGWMMMELFQTSCSLKRNVEFNVLLERFDVASRKDQVIVEGIMFLPIHKVDDEIKNDHVESLPTTEIEWEKRLPSDYAKYLKRPWNFFITHTKEEAYSILSRGVHIKVNNDIRVWFWITNYTGKKCFMVSPKVMVRGYKHEKLEPTLHANESRFKHVLRTSSSNVAMSLEVRNHLFSAKTAYACYFVYKILQPLAQPLRTMIMYKAYEADNVHDLEAHMKVAYLTTPQRPVIGPDGAERSPSTMNKTEGIEFPRMRKDGWWEVRLGEFMPHNDPQPRSMPYASEVEHGANQDEEADDGKTTLPMLWPDRDIPIIDIRLRPHNGKIEGDGSVDVDLVVQGIEFRPLEEE